MKCSINDVYNSISAYAPVALSDEYCAKNSAYDNSGIIINCGEEITGVVCSLDLSVKAVDKALKEGKNLIFTHHPAIYRGVERLNSDCFTTGKYVYAIKNGVSVISMHLNLDVAKGGIDEQMMLGIKAAAGIEGSECEVFECLTNENTGYGRGYDLNGISLLELKDRLKKEFSSENVCVFGEDKKVYKCASFCGAGADAKAVLKAKSFGADAIISSDFQHHIIAMALEAGMGVISLTHYASENYGFEKICEKLFSRGELPYSYHTDESLL